MPLQFSWRLTPATFSASVWAGGYVQPLQEDPKYLTKKLRWTSARAQTRVGKEKAAKEGAKKRKKKKKEKKGEYFKQHKIIPNCVLSWVRQLF